MKIYDVSMPLRPGMPVYTGNPPFERRVTQVLGKDGSPVNESQLVMGVHGGTHIDAPRHFEADGYTRALEVRNAGGGPIAVFGTAAEQRQPGSVYDALGLPGATGCTVAGSLGA